MPHVKFNKQQLSVIEQLENSIEVSALEVIFSRSINELSLDDLLRGLKVSNALYRAGFPVFNDETYDSHIAELKSRAPSHPYLSTVEPEALADSKTVALPKKMLSTDKAYSFEEIKKWTDKLLKAAKEIDVDERDIEIRVTPKLDGYAAYDDGTKLYTRGDGVRGQDITRAFNKGLQVADNGERGLGPGEIVIKKSYFDSVLSHAFENSRNIQAAIIAEKKVDPLVQTAIDQGACVFYPFVLIENWTGHYEKVLADFENIVEKIWNAVDYDIDGVILEVTSDAIKQHMGATRHHHRWQIAFKVNAESAEVRVLKVVPQTSRTGRMGVTMRNIVSNRTHQSTQLCA